MSRDEVAYMSLLDRLEKPLLTLACIYNKFYFILSTTDKTGSRGGDSEGTGSSKNTFVSILCVLF